MEEDEEEVEEEEEEEDEKEDTGAIFGTASSGGDKNDGVARSKVDDSFSASSSRIPHAAHLCHGQKNVSLSFGGRRKRKHN